MYHGYPCLTVFFLIFLYLSVILLFVPFFVSLFTYTDSVYFKMFHQLFALIVNFFFNRDWIFLKDPANTRYTHSFWKRPLWVSWLSSQMTSDALLPLGPVTALLRLSAPLGTLAEDLTPALGRGHSSPL